MMTHTQNRSFKQILVVDDSPFVRRHISSILRKAGYKVLTAPNGVSGAEKALSKIPDLIVSDVEMPRMNGYQMCRLLKNSAATASIPILICTTLDEARNRFWAKKTGADGYIVKGFSEPELLKAVTENLTKTENQTNRQAVTTTEKVKDIVGEVNKILDEKLFDITVINEIRNLAEQNKSSCNLIKSLLQLLSELIDFEVAGIFCIEQNEMFVYTRKQISEAKKLRVKACLTGSFGTKFIFSPEQLPLNPTTVFLDNAETDTTEFCKFFRSRIMSRACGLRSRLQFLIGLHSAENQRYSLTQKKILQYFTGEAAIVLENTFIHEELEHANRRNLELQVFLRNYLSKSVWKDAVGSVGSGLRTLPEKEMEYTILFSDICDFTSFVEKSEIPVVINRLNNHFTILTEAVHACNGDVDKYIGDCLMARFQKPEDALKAAFAFHEALQSQKEKEGFAFEIRVGLNTGKVIEASIGSPVRKDYTVIGDVVNVASRLESICPVGGVMISETTYKFVSDLVQIIDEHESCLKGRKNCIKAYCVTLE
jgi:class 3 adenylate cyclase/CheY-like chemotaxis protein